MTRDSMAGLFSPIVNRATAATPLTTWRWNTCRNSRALRNTLDATVLIPVNITYTIHHSVNGTSCSNFPPNRDLFNVGINANIVSA